MDEKLLIQLTNDNCSLREIAKITGKPQTTVRFWLKKFNLKTKLLVGNKHGLARKPKHLLGDGKKDVWYCKICGESDKNNFYKDSSRSRCAKCAKEEVFKRYHENKKLAIEYKGGQCVKCGYKKCRASLDFHHVDPKEKEFDWRKMRTHKIDDIKKELDKCILVCRNCHNEIHFLDNESL